MNKPSQTILQPRFKSDGEYITPFEELSKTPEYIRRLELFEKESKEWAQHLNDKMTEETIWYLSNVDGN